MASTAPRGRGGCEPPPRNASSPELGGGGADCAPSGRSVGLRRRAGPDGAPTVPRCRGRPAGGGAPRFCGADLFSGPERAAPGLPRDREVGGGGGRQGSRPHPPSGPWGRAPPPAARRAARPVGRVGGLFLGPCVGVCAPGGRPSGGDPPFQRPRGGGCSAWAWLPVGLLWGCREKIIQRGLALVLPFI